MTAAVYMCRMDTKESAAKAIIATHGTQINGYTCKCSWGKETESSSGSQNQSALQQNSAYPQAPASDIHTFHYSNNVFPSYFSSYFVLKLP